MHHLVQQPEKLCCLALERVADWIVEQGRTIADVYEEDPPRGERLLTLQIENIRSWIYHLPHDYHDILAALLIDKLDLESCEIAVRMLETIFSNKLTRLKLEDDIIFHSLHFGPHIQLSRLTELTFSPIDEETTVNILQNLHEIRYLNLLNKLHICEIPSNNIYSIVRCVVECCPLLQHIKLVQYECLNDTVIELLIRLEDLKSVDLEGTGVSREGIKTLLLSCDNLNCITIDDAKLEEALELITFEQPDRQFKLLSYRNSRNTTFNQMKFVVKMCPLIKALQIYHCDVTQRNLFSLAVNLEDLRTIQLSGLDFYYLGTELQYFLEQRGHNLINLDLNYIFQLDLKALNSIFKTCPNLERLSIENGIFEDQDTTDFSNTNFNQLVYLKRLYVMSDTITDDQLFCLLSCCPNVEVVAVRGVHLSDGLLSRVLERNPLTSLQEWSFDSKYDAPSGEILEQMIRNSKYFPKIMMSCTRSFC